MATKVKLRQKAISGGRQSLYLDFYPPIIHPETGKPTRREFLGLYLIDKPKTPYEKQLNNETKTLAENIRAKRQIEIQAGDFGFCVSKHHKNKTDFVEFFKGVAETKTGTNKETWQSTIKHFCDFFGGKPLPVSALNVNLCNDFKNHLLGVKSKTSKGFECISPNSARTYHRIFKTALKEAYKKGLIEHDLSTRIDSIKGIECKREYLSLEQLQTLVKTPCKNQTLKNAAIFSALTGLRFSDVSKLVWGEVQFSETEGYFLHIRQKKTGGVEILPISKQAFQLLGERKGPTTKVFDGLVYSSHLNNQLKEWVRDAGINKRITFHCFRHTFATLQLSLGTDIYTVSKMLGHKDLHTTQIYAKIVDESKRKAANKIKLDL